ncbi:putative protein without homology [Propionibacterium freudenreichii subsp. shermanii]|nr:putative protein without homology [Propionibacterium freudenreichii subsp. shermanii]
MIAPDKAFDPRNRRAPREPSPTGPHRAAEFAADRVAGPVVHR